MVEIVDKIWELMIMTLSVSPQTKRSILCLDNLKVHSGYIEYYIFEYYIFNLHGLNNMPTKMGAPDKYPITLPCSNKFRYSCERGGRTSIVAEPTAILEDYNVNDAALKEELLADLHIKGQILVGELIDRLREIINDNHGITQAELGRITGITKKYNDHNWIISTLLRLGQSQGIFERRTGRKAIYDVVNSKPYEPFEYVPCCKEKSTLEARVKALLKKYGFSNFVQQKKFADCKDKREMPFDFYVDERFLIEVQGRQHFEHVPYFHKTVEEFETCRRHDEMKREFAKKSDIPLLEIRYDDDFEEKLVAFLKEYIW